MSDKTYLKWEELNFNWENIQRDDGEYMLWEDISLIEEIEKIFRKGGGISVGDGYSEREYIARNLRKAEKELGKEKVKKFVKIYCRINGIEYTEEKMKNEDIDISIDKLENVFEETKKTVLVKNISIK